MRFLSTLVASALGTLLAFGVMVLFFFLFIFAVALSGEPEPSVSTGSVLVVEVDGPIPERQSEDPFARAFGPEGASYDVLDLKGALRKAAVDRRIDGVWLQLRGTNASWATLEEVRSALEAFKKESGKPLIASSRDFGLTEKTYFLASTADSVFAAPQAPFEYNGFYITTEFFQHALDKLDIEPQVVRAGKFKSAVEPFIRDDLSDENRLQLNALLESQNSRFMQAVAKNRSLDTATLDTMADTGAILSVDDAVEAGLIDGIRYHDEVADLIKEQMGYEPNDNLRTTKVSRYKGISGSSVGLEPTGDGEIAVVYAEGSIVSGKSDDTIPISGPGFIGSETFAEAMRNARTSDRVKAVVLRINSPGGLVSASESMWHAIKRTAEEKPVIASMGGVAASGGYYIAVAADSIVADPLTITGSIGVFGLFFDASGLFENKLGVTFDGVSTSPYADIYSGLRPFSENERQLLETNIDETYQQFLERVAEGRGMTVEAVDEIAQGRVWSGEDARRVGLVDTLGTLGDAIRMAAQKVGLGDGPYRVRLLPRPKTFIERLNEALYTRAAQAWMHVTSSPLERSLMEQQRVLRDLARTHGTAQARLPYTLHIE